MRFPTAYIAIPAINEFNYLPHTIECLLKQNYPNIQIFVCVNQAEDFWEMPEKFHICENNQKTLAYLKNLFNQKIHILDYCSRGNGLPKKNAHVGMARKICMDKIAALATDDDIMISLDADTTFSHNYVSSVVEIFKRNDNIVAHANPYYHCLTGEEEHDKNILRYELYMRYYAINLWRIKSPFSFTALGSAIALPIGVYKKVRGIDPKKSGEDFYFLQKLAKHGKISTYNKEIVYPSGRISDRVFFGTGPALQRGPSTNWKSYPFYAMECFDEVFTTYQNLESIYNGNYAFPLTNHLSNVLNKSYLLDNIRKNAKTIDTFVKAFHALFDALFILQYLHSRNSKSNISSESNLLKLINLLSDNKNIISNYDSFCFQKASVSELEKIRKILIEIETNYQKNNYCGCFSNFVDK